MRIGTLIGISHNNGHTRVIYPLFLEMRERNARTRINVRGSLAVSAVREEETTRDEAFNLLS